MTIFIYIATIFLLAGYTRNLYITLRYERLKTWRRGDTISHNGNMYYYITHVGSNIFFLDEKGREKMIRFSTTMRKIK